MNNHQIYYETMYILRPDIAEEEVNEHIEKYNKLLEKLGGKVLDSQMRGKRRLAYQIGKHREGIYVQLSHLGDGQHVSKIEKSMRLSEDVIRYMTVKQDGPLPTPKPSKKVVKSNDNQDVDSKVKKDISNGEKEDEKSKADNSVDKTSEKSEDKATTNDNVEKTSEKSEDKATTNDNVEKTSEKSEDKAQ